MRAAVLGMALLVALVVVAPLAIADDEAPKTKVAENHAHELFEGRMPLQIAGAVESLSR